MIQDKSNIDKAQWKLSQEFYSSDCNRLKITPQGQAAESKVQLWADSFNLVLTCASLVTEKTLIWWITARPVSDLFKLLMTSSLWRKACVTGQSFISNKHLGCSLYVFVDAVRLHGQIKILKQCMEEVSLRYSETIKLCLSA